MYIRYWLLSLGALCANRLLEKKQYSNDDTRHSGRKDNQFGLILLYLRKIFHRDEVQRNAVDAVAQPGGLRAVGKNVALVAAAASTGHLNAAHTVAVVYVFVDVVFVDGLVETGPSGTGVELGVGGKKREATGGTGENASAFFVVQLAGEGALRAVFAQYVIGGGVKHIFPVAFGLINFFEDTFLSRRIVLIIWCEKTFVADDTAGLYGVRIGGLTIRVLHAVLTVYFVLRQGVEAEGARREVVRPFVGQEVTVVYTAEAIDQWNPGAGVVLEFF